jgi:glycosyltransferase involved in cell wall biosynthesis
VYNESNLWREYDAADIFVFPTYAEGFPRVILEAMARGLPVVSTRVSGIPGLVKDHALLVSPGSPHEVAEAILKVIDDPMLRRNLIRGGRDIARQYTLEETTRRRAEAIRSVLLPV